MVPDDPAVSPLPVGSIPRGGWGAHPRSSPRGIVLGSVGWVMPRAVQTSLEPGFGGDGRTLTIDGSQPTVVDRTSGAATGNSDLHDGQDRERREGESGPAEFPGGRSAPDVGPR